MPLCSPSHPGGGLVAVPAHAQKGASDSVHSLARDRKRSGLFRAGSVSVLHRVTFVTEQKMNPDSSRLLFYSSFSLRGPHDQGTAITNRAQSDLCGFY